MRFAFTEEQLELARVTRELLARACPPTAVRAAWETAPDVPPAWKELAAVTRMIDGQPLGASSSVHKLAWSELDVHLHATALALLGPRAELASEWSKGWQFALAGPIYAGTNEIQKNVVAERLLGLPKAKP